MKYCAARIDLGDARGLESREALAELIDDEAQPLCGEVMVMNGDSFLAELDLQQMALNFTASETGGKAWTVMDVIDVLKGWGMRLRSDGRWLCDISTIELFRDDEVIDVWNISAESSDPRY